MAGGMRPARDVAGRDGKAFSADVVSGSASPLFRGEMHFGKQKGRDSFESLPFRNVSEELFLLLDGFLDGFLGRGFLLSCHGESPPLQIALVARNRANKYLSLA